MGSKKVNEDPNSKVEPSVYDRRGQHHKSDSENKSGDDFKKGLEELNKIHNTSVQELHDQLHTSQQQCSIHCETIK